MNRRWLMKRAFVRTASSPLDEIDSRSVRGRPRGWGSGYSGRITNSSGTFPSSAALSDSEIISYSTIARDCGVSDKTIRGYFSILFDTMLAAPLSAFQRRPKRRTIQSPKFYFFDVGVVNYLARRIPVEPGTDRFGKAFENWVHHELRSYVSYRRPLLPLSFWRLSTGVEVDFILGDMEVALEAKASGNVHQDHLKGLRELQKDHREVKRRIVVSLESRSRTTNDGIDVLTCKDFAEKLWSNKLL